MSADIAIAIVAPASGRSRSPLRLLLPLVGFAAILVAVVGVRTYVAQHQAAAETAAYAAATKSFPTNLQIEQAWGIRLTAVRLLNDNGSVEMRYTTLDPAKAGRLHSANLTDLPYVRAEDSGKEVHSYSIMYNLHTAHAGDDLPGETYSLVYGNSDGAVHPGGLVTIVFADGLQLQHVAVG